jgi:hypothetical protein
MPNTIGNKVKMEENRANQQIKNIMLRMKKAHEKFRFFSEYAEAPKAKIESTILEQKALLKILHDGETVPLEPQDEKDSYLFYEENQKWLGKEIEEFLQQAKPEEEEEEE